MHGEIHKSAPPAAGSSELHASSHTLHREQLPEQDEAPPEFSSITILLVDDDADIRSLSRTFLEHIGFRVLTSGDCDRALHIFDSVPRVDLLIADHYMPGRSGMELAITLKRHRPELPVLMISGGPLEFSQRQQLAQPGWSFLPKPFSLPALLAAVHTILQGRKAHAAASARH